MDEMLKIDNIKKSILAYVFDKRKKQAVLLDGEWGSGKTFFVEKYIIPELEKNKNAKIFKISLYGISSVETIQEMIYAQWLGRCVDKITDKLGPIGQLVNKGIDIFGTSAVRALENKLSAEGVSDKIASTIMDNDINKAEYMIIIFDDLERCRINILQLMGFLNNLSENNGFKLILVANEREIKHKDNSIEEALKYLVALKNKESVLKEYKSFDSAWSKDELREATIDIFNEKTLYELTKEKLIGLTVSYRVSPSEIFEPVIKNCIKNEHICRKVIDNKDCIIKLFIENNHGNIRTLMAACIVIEDILDIIYKNITEDKELIDRELNNIILYSIYSAIRRATGESLFEWESDSRYAYLNNNLMETCIYGYAFIDEYWKTQYVDKDIIMEDIKAKISYCKEIEEYKKRKKDYDDLALRKLIKWYLLEDNEVHILIKQMKKELDDKKYQPYEFKDIICTLININNPKFGMYCEENKQQGSIILYDPMEGAQFEDMKLEYSEETSICNIYSNWEKVDINEFVQSMVSYFKETGYIVTKDIINIVSSDKQFTYTYRIFMMPIIEIIEKYELEEKSKVNNNMYISDIPWDDSFKELLMGRRGKYIDQGRFLYFFDYEKLSNRILEASPYKIHKFCDAVESVYKYSNIAEIFTNDRYMVNKVGMFIDDNFEKLVDQGKSRTMEIALRRLKALFLEYRKEFEHIKDSYSTIK